MDTKQSPTNLGYSWGVNCLVVFPTPFNPNNSLLKLLQTSLLFMFTQCMPKAMKLWSFAHITGLWYKIIVLYVFI